MFLNGSSSILETCKTKRSSKLQFLVILGNFTKTFCLLTFELLFALRNARDIATNGDGIANNKREIDLLKQISTELDVKSQEDEKKVSDLNVTIENLNMNFSLY